MDEFNDTQTPETDDFDAFDVDVEAVAEAASNCLVPSPNAKKYTNNKGEDCAKWDEVCTVASIKFERLKEMRNTEPGDVLGVLQVGLRVDMESTWEDGDNPNINRRFTDFSRFNFTAAQQRKGSKHATMTGMSWRQFKGLLGACGLPTDTDTVKNPGRTLAQFSGDIIGSKINATIIQRTQVGRDEPQDEVDRFFIYEEVGF